MHDLKYQLALKWQVVKMQLITCVPKNSWEEGQECCYCRGVARLSLSRWRNVSTTASN